MNEDLEYLNIMLDNFKLAILKNEQQVYMGYSYIEDNDDYLKEYYVPRKEWENTIDILIECAVDIEAYEIASEYKNLKELI